MHLKVVNYGPHFEKLLLELFLRYLQFLGNYFLDPAKYCSVHSLKRNLHAKPQNSNWQECIQRKRLRSVFEVGLRV